MSDTNAIPKYESDVVKIFDIHTLKDFVPEKRVRKKFFKTEQLWTEIACYEPGQSTVMHNHPLEEEMIYVVEGVANMNIGGEEVQLSAGSLAKFPVKVMHDIRNLQDERLVIMFTKSPRKLPRA